MQDAGSGSTLVQTWDISVDVWRSRVKGYGLEIFRLGDKVF